MLLLTMSALIAFVGAIGLAGTLSINVLERRREIGVMRAIGASSFQIAAAVRGRRVDPRPDGVGHRDSAERAGGAVVLAGHRAGINFGVVYQFSWNGALQWLIIIVVLSILGAALPACAPPASASARAWRTSSDSLDNRQNAAYIINRPSVYYSATATIHTGASTMKQVVFSDLLSARAYCWRHVAEPDCCGGDPDDRASEGQLGHQSGRQVAAAQSVNLSFVTGGEVAEVLVKEGDAVKAGDVIARVKCDAQQAAVARAEAGVAAAKASEAKYLEQLPQQIAAAEAEVQSAEAQIAASAAKQNDPAAIAAAEAAVYQARVSQQAAEDAYQKVLDKKLYGPTEEQARLVVETAKRTTQAAELRLKQLKSGSAVQATGAEIEAAQARLAAAQARLDQSKAEANGQPNPTYAAAIQQAEAALQSAKTAVADTELRAPFAGTIASST